MFEINLVPDVKAEMIKTQKLRNAVFLFSGLAVVLCGIVLLIFGGIKAGQDITMSSQDATIEQFSEKINSYDDLAELLSIQEQLDKLSIIADEKKLLSRIFSVFNSLIPTNGDEIKYSELTINFEENKVSFDAQADAKTSNNDWTVLEAFKKSMPMMRYDYGRYVTEDGEEIPTVCILESSADGETYQDATGGLYAIWTRGVKGCDPSTGDDGTLVSEDDVEAARYNYDSEKIWRTPQFTDWYSQGYLTEDGVISDVAHFESACINYSFSTDRWTSTNNCNLIVEDISIESSTNALDAEGQLVLRFSATITFNEEVFLAKNKHMIAIAPTGRTNVTDSYIQIGGMFSKKAECIDGDTSCLEDD